MTASVLPIALILLSILFGLTYGYTEGIVFYQPNSRCHKYFRFYHAINSARFISLALIIFNYKYLIDNLSLSAGLIVTIWEFSEIFYRIARYDIDEIYEHINFAEVIDFYIYGNKVVAMHIARVAVAALLIFGGIK